MRPGPWAPARRSALCLLLWHQHRPVSLRPAECTGPARGPTERPGEVLCPLRIRAVTAQDQAPWPRELSPGAPSREGRGPGNRTQGHRARGSACCLWARSLGFHSGELGLEHVHCLNSVTCKRPSQESAWRRAVVRTQCAQTWSIRAHRVLGTIGGRGWDMWPRWRRRRAGSLGRREGDPGQGCTAEVWRGLAGETGEGCPWLLGEGGGIGGCGPGHRRLGSLLTSVSLGGF